LQMREQLSVHTGISVPVMRKPARLMPLILTALLTLAGCVGPLKTAAPVPAADQALVTKAVEDLARISEFKGYGEITMAGSGSKMTGNFDALRKNTGSFNAQVYSPFGTAVASITAEEFAGRVNIDKEQIDFAYDNAMTGVPFPCVGRFTYGQFVNLLTASMPDEFWAYAAEPYTPVQGQKWIKGKGRVAAAWSSDTLVVRAAIFPKTGRIEMVTFDYNVGGSRLSMQFGRFKKGVPYEIQIKEGSKNYITVNYESITWK